MTDQTHTDSVADDGPTEPGEHCYEVPRGAEPGVGIVEAVADATDVGPMALPPLNDTIDVDALNAIVGSSDPDERTTITLQYADTVVVIDGDETITVQ